MIRNPGPVALSAASLLALAACQTGPDGITSPKAAVRGFYGDYAGDFRKAETARLSKSLAAEVERARANEVESAARTKAGPSPTDKPNILEGEIFAGLYEGYTSYRMGPARVIGDRASGCCCRRWAPTSWTTTSCRRASAARAHSPLAARG